MLHPDLKWALDEKKFPWFNDFLNDPEKRDTAHENDNYALKSVVKNGVLSSTKELMKINAVWTSFNAPELMHLAHKYSGNPGVARFVQKCIADRSKYVEQTAAIQRFYSLLQAVENAEDVAKLVHEFRNSQLVREKAAQNNNAFLKLAIQRGAAALVKEMLKEKEVGEQCGLNELYFALTYPPHDIHIVRALLNVPAIAEQLSDNDMDLLVEVTSSGRGEFFDGLEATDLECFEGVLDNVYFFESEVYCDSEDDTVNESKIDSDEEPRSLSAISEDSFDDKLDGSDNESTIATELLSDDDSEQEEAAKVAFRRYSRECLFSPRPTRRSAKELDDSNRKESSISPTW